MDVPRIVGETLDDHRERMRDRIFESFATLLHDDGYDSVTLARVAADADIGRTVMYNYYRDKDSLLVAYTARSTGQYVERLLAELSESSDAMEMLRIFIRMQITELATTHLALMALTNTVSDAARRKLHAHIAPLRGTLHAILSDAMSQGYMPEADVDETLPLVIASITGPRVMELSGDDLEQAIDSTTRYVFRALGVVSGDSGEPIPTAAQHASGSTSAAAITLARSS